MSVHSVYSRRDEERVRQAKRRGRKPSQLRPVPRPVGWQVRWRPERGANPLSHTLLISEGFSREDADELDRRTKHIKRTNNGRAPRHLVFGGPDPSREMPTVQEFALETFVKYVVEQLKPSTQRDYLMYLDDAILRSVTVKVTTVGGKQVRKKTYETSRLAPMRLDEVRRHHVVAWLQELADRGTPKRQVELALDTLQSLFKQAILSGYIETNPAHGVRPQQPKGVKRIKPVMPNRVVDPANIERVRRYLELVGASRDWMLMGLMAYAGFRPSELFPFYWHELVDETGRALPYIASNAAFRTRSKSTRQRPDPGS